MQKHDILSAMKPTQKIRDEVIARDKRICQYCGKGKLYKRQLHIDHIIPESQGGKYVVDNLIVACSRCNMQKGAKSQAKYVTDRIAQINRELCYLQALNKKP